MKEVIQKAYEGGYRPEKLNSKFEWSEDMRSATEEYQVDWRDCVLDPLFWQALGKGLSNTQPHIGGWAAGKWVWGSPDGKEWWLYHWHRFIDHLASNGNVDEFFTELLK